MKKFLAILLALVLVLALAACGEKDDKGGDAVNVDLSKYPANFDDWTSSDLLNYFKEAVPALADCEDWYQPHSPYWTGTPFEDCSGTWNDDGSIQIACHAFATDFVDTTKEEVEAFRQAFINDKNHGYLEDGYMFDATSHMAGKMLVDYENSYDEAAYDAMEAAWQALVAAMKLTPEY